jgi:hypothetical protein
VFRPHFGAGVEFQEEIRIESIQCNSVERPTTSDDSGESGTPLRSWWQGFSQSDWTTEIVQGCDRLRKSECASFVSIVENDCVHIVTSGEIGLGAAARSRYCMTSGLTSQVPEFVPGAWISAHTSCYCCIWLLTRWSRRCLRPL